MLSLRALLTGLFLLAAPMAQADAARLDELYAALATADENGWQVIEDEIWQELSASGSATLDLLLERGRAALETGDTAAAIDHLSVLTENAPDFAEGWNARATAYYQAGLIGPAMADIARCLSLEPRHIGALAGLGLILEETGDLSQAREAYRAAHDLHPRQPELPLAIERLDLALGVFDL